MSISKCKYLLNMIHFFNESCAKGIPLFPNSYMFSEEKCNKQIVLFLLKQQQFLNTFVLETIATHECGENCCILHTVDPSSNSTRFPFPSFEPLRAANEGSACNSNLVENVVDEAIAFEPPPLEHNVPILQECQQSADFNIGNSPPPPTRAKISKSKQPAIKKRKMNFDSRQTTLNVAQSALSLNKDPIEPLKFTPLNRVPNPILTAFKNPIHLDEGVFAFLNMKLRVNGIFHYEKMINGGVTLAKGDKVTTVFDLDTSNNSETSIAVLKEGLNLIGHVSKTDLGFFFNIPKRDSEIKGVGTVIKIFTDKGGKAAIVCFTEMKISSSEVSQAKLEKVYDLLLSLPYPQN